MATYALSVQQNATSSNTMNYKVSCLVNASELNNYIRNNIPRYSIINSVVISTKIKRNGISLSTSNTDLDWCVFDTSGNVETVLQENSDGITTSFKTFTYDAKNYVYSDSINSGIMNDSSKVVGYHAHGLTAKTYTIELCKMTYDYTAPVVGIHASVRSGQGTVQINGGTAGASATVTEYVTIAGKTYTIKATPASGYKFKQWSDGVVSASRSITVSDGTISAHGTEFFYYAIFEEEEQNNTFVGTKRSAAYVGTSRAAVYVGTKKVN